MSVVCGQSRKHKWHSLAPGICSNVCEGINPKDMAVRVVDAREKKLCGLSEHFVVLNHSADIGFPIHSLLPIQSITIQALNAFLNGICNISSTKLHTRLRPQPTNQGRE